MKRAIFVVMLLTVISCLIGRAYADDYRIKPGDTLGVTVLDEQELTKHVVVDPQGSISLPLVNQVNIANMTLTQATQELTKRLSKFLKSPQVSVDLVEAVKLQVTVSGEVRTPGIYSAAAGAHLMDLLTQAGGYTANSDLTRVAVTHSGNAGSATVDLNSFLLGVDASANVPISSGDTIIVPARQTQVVGMVSVLGAVRQSGEHPFTKGMTLSEGVMLAGGPTEMADTSKITIRHLDSTSATQVNYEAAISGDPNANPVLKPGDVIYVGTRAQMGYYTIQGGVTNPGRYELKDNTSLTEAIAIAGGIKGKAKLDQVRVLRNSNGVTQTLQANVSNIMNGKAPNIAIQNQDSINVPQGSEGTDYLRLMSLLLSAGWLLTR